MAARNQRNNLLAGSLVVFAIIATVVVVVLISGGLAFLGQREFEVGFPLSTSVTGLASGSEVRLGGEKVGSVREVRFERDGEGRIVGTIVRIGVRGDVELREGVVASLERPLLGTAAALNFASLGEGEPLAEGARVEGAMSPPEFLKQAGFGDEEVTLLRDTFRRANSMVKDAEQAVGDFRSTVLADIRQITSDARVRSETWFDRIDTITANAEDASANVNDVLESVRLRVESVEELVRTAQAYLDENRSDVRAMVSNARSTAEKADEVMERVRTEIADQIDGLIEDGRQVARETLAAVERVDTLIAEQSPEVRKTIANIRLASDQFVDAAGEIRRSPWRLLYRPDQRELEYEMLYDSARTYAKAVSDLRAATESLRVVIETGGRAATRGETLEPILDSLYGAFDRYNQTERRFLEELQQTDD